MKKTLIVVQCRFKSQRLSAKALLPLDGIPILAFLLRRLKTCLPVQRYRIVLATTTHKDDDITTVWGNEEGVEVIRGSEQDVLSRYILCANRFDSQLVVRVTADNPFTCPVMLDALVKTVKKNGADYGYCENIPFGVHIDVFTPHILKLLDKKAKKTDEREHINLYILRHLGEFKQYVFKVTGKCARPDVRLTVDTEQDYKRICKIVKTGRNKKPWSMPLDQAIKRVDSLHI